MVVKGMKFKLKHLTFMSAIALTATTAGLSVPAAVKSQSPSTIKIDGSSTVFPITEAVAEDFQQQRRGAARLQLVFPVLGRFQKFCRGETDISDASRPIKTEEMAACKRLAFSTSIASGV